MVTICCVSEMLGCHYYCIFCSGLSDLFLVFGSLDLMDTFVGTIVVTIGTIAVVVTVAVAVDEAVQAAEEEVVMAVVVVEEEAEAGVAVDVMVDEEDEVSY